MTASDFLARVIGFHFRRFWGIALSFSATGVWLYSCAVGRLDTGDDALVTLFLTGLFACIAGLVQSLVAFTLNSASPFNIIGNVVRLRSFPFKETSFEVGEVRSIHVRGARVHPLLDLVVRRARVTVVTRAGEIRSKYFFCGPHDVNRDVERSLVDDLYIAQGHFSLVGLPNEGRTITYRVLPTAALQTVLVPVMLVLLGALLAARHGASALASQGFLAALAMWGAFMVARFTLWQVVYGRRRITIENDVAWVRTLAGTREYRGVSRVRVVRGEHYAGFKLLAPPTYLVVHYADTEGAGVVEMRMPRGATTAQIIDLPRAALRLVLPEHAQSTSEVARTPVRR
ncbi:hypothetical protein JT358_16205 [Micrococcales bacterium 31B]|nr:hypothetical protein [Micrococcales bacterium 31B]